METKPTPMTTVTAVLEKLRQKHNDHEFKVSEQGDGFTTDNSKTYHPEDLTIIKTYRFEGASDPGDSSIIYLMQANDGTMGYSMDAYGMYSTQEDAHYDDLIKKIPVQEREEQAIFS